MIEYLRHQHTAHICLDLGWIEEEKYQKWYAENALGAIFARIDAFHFDTLCNFNIETGSQNTIGSQKNPGYSKPRSLKVFKRSLGNIDNVDNVYSADNVDNVDNIDTTLLHILLRPYGTIIMMDSEVTLVH